MAYLVACQERGCNYFNCRSTEQFCLSHQKAVICNTTINLLDLQNFRIEGPRRWSIYCRSRNSILVSSSRRESDHYRALCSATCWRSSNRYPHHRHLRHAQEASVLPLPTMRSFQFLTMNLLTSESDKHDQAQWEKKRA